MPTGHTTFREKQYVCQRKVVPVVRGDDVFSPVRVRVIAVLFIGSTPLVRVSTAMISDDGAPGDENAKAFDFARELRLYLKQ